MQSTEQISNDLVEDVTEILGSALRVKGQAFENVTAGLFELLQVSNMVGVMEARAKAGGVGVGDLPKLISDWLTTVSTRLILMLPEEQREESRLMSLQLIDRRLTALEKAYHQG